MSIGDRIKQVRKALDLTQQKFAEQIGTTANVLTNYETGRRNPSSSAINNICKTFKIKETWLRTGDGEPFVTPDDNAIEELIKENRLSPEQAELMRIFMSMPEKKRDAVAKAFFDFVDAAKSCGTLENNEKNRARNDGESVNSTTLPLYMKTREEAHSFVDECYDAIEKGHSTTG